MKRITKSVFLVLFFVSNSYASSKDYIFPFFSDYSFSNYGTTGLLSNPNARFQEEGTIAFAWNRMQPYLRGSIIAYPFSWMEASYQYTDLNNRLYSSSFSFSGNQSLKDKGFDLKIKLLDETYKAPAVAIGFRDIAGTGLFSSEYIVGSKNFQNIDFTIGLGWGTLSKGNYKNPLGDINSSFYKRTYEEGGGQLSTGSYFSGEMGVFGGLEIFFPKLRGLRLKVEYDGVDYNKEAYPPINQDSELNFGFTYPVSDSLQIRLGLVRGNTLNLSFALKGKFGRKEPFLKKIDKPKPVKNASIIKGINSRRDDRFLYTTVANRLNDRKIFFQTGSKDGDKLEVTYSQTKYLSPIRAAGRAARVLDELSPDSIKTFKLNNVNAGMGIYSISIDREKFKRNKTIHYSDISEENLSAYSFAATDYKFVPKPELPTIINQVSPILRSQIGGPDGFFFGDLRLSLDTEVIFSRNLTLTSNLSYGLANNYDNLDLPSNSILPRVRTDIVDYMKMGDGFTIDHLQANYFSNPYKDLYYKFSVGYFEQMFGGFGGEILYRPFSKNYAFGAELWNAKQRSYKQNLKFKKYDIETGFINLYYYLPSQDIQFHIKGGRFLAKDSGLYFDFSKFFKNGTRIGAYFSRTDISYEEFGEGSFDKGFYFFIPIEAFFSDYRKDYTGFGLRPITRDGGAFINHQYGLWTVTNNASYYNLLMHRSDLYD